MSSEASVVHVQGIAPNTSVAALNDYFSFVGDVESVQFDTSAAASATSKSAKVTFKRPSAATSAVMLSGGVVDGSVLTITLPSAASAEKAAEAEVSTSTTASASSVTPQSVAQEDKPRTARIAELLAHGYTISDDVAQRAIAYDKQHGLSNKFLAYLSSLDKSLGEQISKRNVGGVNLTEKTEHTPSGSAANVSATEKEAQSAPVPGDAPGQPDGPKTTTTVPADASQAKTASAHAQKAVEGLRGKAGEVLARPEVKARTDFAWAKFNEYYSAVANHPRIHSLYTSAHKTVTDVHEEASRIAAEKKQAAGSAPDPALPPRPAQSGLPLVFVALICLIFFNMQQVALAHSGGAEDLIEPAEIAHEKPHKKGEESYIQRHMASEHHIGAFDLGAFFSLHDLNRDGILDRPEIEAIYGVHHSESVKVSPTYEVHDAKADHIVSEVLRRLDHNRDGVVTKAEFIAAGPDGLPSFEQYGTSSLGHHYDEESEYFVHHEEIYHNTPETQDDSAYTHKEDLEHFAHHQRIEDEEERRERKAEGLPTKEEDERRRKEAEAKGQKYVSPYEAQMPSDHSPAAPQRAYESHDGWNGAAFEAQVATEHTFHTPDGVHVVKTAPDEALRAHLAATEHKQHLEKEPGETEEGFKARVAAHAQRKLAAEAYAKANPAFNEANGGPASASASGAAAGVTDERDAKTGELKRRPGESETDYGKRKQLARFNDAKGRSSYRPSRDETRKAAPYKSRVKPGSYFGEF
ncbi:precursor to secretory protein ssp120 [Ceraceosorus bombacis]|uniref:Precursor to secretory protein ssp120 n=1 Tax=Ceraceosorus bombacis TaxID=401625 RepID=A0A0P1BMJ3_9BASI|nr:precursor to secretory protein ssp120 [Ceraceosorus bombacis]